jgi:two-component system, LuxR family, response regulator FixJ
VTGVLERPYVYLIDADESARSSYRKLLQPLGFHIQDYADGASFLENADIDVAGCVVLDFQLPEIGGPELHKQLRNRGSPLAVVFVSAHGDVPSAVTAMQHGAIDFLLKPVREQQLLDVVNRALRKSAADAVHGRARRTVLNQLARLTPRERQVLQQLVEGVHYDRVSSALGITKRTVEAHRRRIMEKMGARTLPQLLQQLARAGWPARVPAARDPAH